MDESKISSHTPTTMVFLHCFLSEPQVTPIGKEKNVTHDNGDNDDEFHSMNTVPVAIAVCIIHQFIKF